MPRKVFTVEEDRQHRAMDPNYQRCTILVDGVPVFEIAGHRFPSYGKTTIRVEEYGPPGMARQVPPGSAYEVAHDKDGARIVLTIKHPEEA